MGRAERAVDGAALERLGEAEAAAQLYVAQGRPADAARVLLGSGRVPEAAQVLFEALAADGFSLAALPPDRRRQAYTAAVLLAESGRARESQRLLLGLGAPEAAERVARRVEAQQASIEQDLGAVAVAEARRAAGDLLGAAEAYGAAGASDRAAMLYLEAGRFRLALEALVDVGPAHPDYRWAARVAIGIAERQRDLHPRLSTFLASFVATGPEDGEEDFFLRLRSLYRQHGFPEEALAVQRRLDAPPEEDDVRSARPRGDSAGKVAAPGLRVGGFLLLHPESRRGPRAWRAVDGQGSEVVMEFVGAVPPGPGAEERVERSVAFLRSIEHPALVRYLDGGLHEGAAYLVTEALDGVPLLEAERGELPAEVARLAAVLGGLQHLHEQGLLHRRLRAEDVVVTDAGARLCGFGASLLGLEPRAVPAPDEACYLAPEELGGLARPTARADLFALAALGLHRLAGRAPLPHVDPEALLFERLTRGLPPPPGSRSRLPLRLEQALAAALSVDPQDRPASAADLAAALEAALAAR